MRVLLGVMLGLIVGFSAGWAVFKQPWSVDSAQASAVTARRVEAAVLKRSRFRDATCHQIAYPEHAWECALTDDLGMRYLEGVMAPPGRRWAFEDASIDVTQTRR
jgi:hypothetical protein